MKTKQIFSFILTSSFLLSAYGGSATWNVNPSSNDWNTALNWTPHTVPNGPRDIATFTASNMASPVIHASVELDTLIFGDSTLTPFTIMVGEAGGQAAASLTLNGTGITNDSDASLQALQATPTLATNGASNSIILRNNATLPGQGQAFCFLTALGAVSSGLVGGEIQFFDNASAGFAAVEADKGQNGGGPGQVSFFNNSSAGEGQVVNIAGAGASAAGVTMFHDQATAGSATVTNYAASTAGVEGGTTLFFGSSSASDSAISTFGGVAANAGGGKVIFSDTSSAGNAILNGNGSTVGLAGSFEFLVDSTGGTALLIGSGDLVIADHNPPGITIGSIEGGGNVFLGSNNLTVGSANLTQTYFGVIQGSGSLIKIGTGILTLSGSNTYSGGTTISGGAFRIMNESASATGSGPVQVNNGTFGGTGIVTGAVTIGTGAGTGATLKAASGTKLGNLTIQSQLTFRADGDYRYKLNTKRGIGDQVTAHGITIQSGAQFEVQRVANKTLTAGMVFTALNNTATTPITGSFANLPDGSVLFVGQNSLQVSYEGGDGNDLTFTVLP